MTKRKTIDPIVKKEPTIKTEYTSPPPLIKKKRSYKSDIKRIQNIVDPYTFYADQAIRLRSYGTGPILRRARHMLLGFLRDKDYKSSLALLAALIDTSRYSANFYWKVGAEIIQHLQPDALIPYLENVMVGVKRNQQLEALTDCLLEILQKQGYDAFRGRIDNLPETDEVLEPMIAKLVALVTYEEWRKEKDKMKKKYLEEQTYELMKLVYSANVMDRHIVKAYLEILSAQKPRPEIEIKEVVERTLLNTTDDPEFLSILLYYGSAEMPDLILSQSNFCNLDPVADARISFLPLIKTMKSVQSTDPYFTMVSLARAKVITVRLDYGCDESCTLDELDFLLEDISSMTQELAIKVLDFLITAGLPSTLDRLQMTTEDIETMDVLEFLKYKVLRLSRHYIPTPVDVLVNLI